MGIDDIVKNNQALSNIAYFILSKYEQNAKLLYRKWSHHDIFVTGMLSFQTSINQYWIMLDYF
jgi:hypothetical protein